MSLPDHFARKQWWLASLDRYGNAKLIDGAHQSLEEVEKSATLWARLALAQGLTLAAAEVNVIELTGKHGPLNESAIATLNGIGLKP